MCSFHLCWRRFGKLLFWNILTDMKLGYFRICCRGCRRAAFIIGVGVIRGRGSFFIRGGLRNNHLFRLATFLMEKILPFYIGP